MLQANNRYLYCERNISYWDTRLSWASTAYFIGSVGNASLKSILPIPESLWGTMSVLVGVGILGTYWMNSKEMIRRSSGIFLRSFSIFIVLYALSAILMTSRGESLNTMITGNAILTFAWWIPTGVYACSVYNKETLYKVWVKAAYIISAFSIIIYFFHIPDKKYEELAEYNMSYGYFIILPLLIQVNEFCRYKNKWLLLLILFESFTLLVYANRGVFLSLIFFLVYKFAFESDSRARKVFSILFLIILGLIMLASIQTIASILVYVFDAFGFESRTLSMIAEGSVTSTTGRDALWSICFKMIEERPIIGWGLGGEYTYLTQAFQGASEASSSCSPHNGVVQNFVNFGIIGGIISTMLILIPLLHLNRVRDPYAKILIVVFCAARVVPNFISGDGFFIEPKVAIYLYLFYFWKRGYKRSQTLLS